MPAAALETRSAKHLPGLGLFASAGCPALCFPAMHSPWGCRDSRNVPNAQHTILATCDWPCSPRSAPALTAHATWPNPCPAGVCRVCTIPSLALHPVQYKRPAGYSGQGHLGGPAGHRLLCLAVPQEDLSCALRDHHDCSARLAACAASRRERHALHATAMYNGGLSEWHE